MAIGKVLTLNDIRDNNQYTVAKLNDSKCWMVQNLRIVDKQISSNDSTIEETNFTIPASDLSKIDSTNYDSDFVYYDGNPEHGAYYSWHTATAGSGKKDIERGDALYSICPKGWHLPSYAEYEILKNNYPGTQMTSSPIPHFLTIGYIYSSNGPTGSSSYYWSSTASSSRSSAYVLYISNTSSGRTSPSRYYGAFVRCVAGGEPKNYSITYVNNNGTNNTVKNKYGTSDTVVIDIPNPVKSGSLFAGWCDKQTTGGVCTGKIYQNGDTYQTNGNPNLTFYALWGINRGNLGTMQSFSCSSKLPNYHDYGTVTDTRDNSTYTVAKLLDGKCWMTQNLRIIGKSISSSNSNVTSNFSIPSSNISNFYTGSNYDTDNVKNNNAAYYGSNTSYGAYYTWYTATAGTGTSSITSSDVNATSSICPKGWRLPTGDDNGEFQALITAYDINGNSSEGRLVSIFRGNPLNFVLAGQIPSDKSFISAPSDPGIRGTNWTSTSSDDATEAYTFYLYDDGSTFRAETSSSYRSWGKPVRCIAI